MLGISLPELKELVAKEQGETNLAGVSTDPRFDAYQDETQERLAGVGRSGGFDARSRARMEQARLENAQAERASREGVLADARARGTLGTGEELSALLQTGQASADRARMADVETLADAEDRALEAIIANGSMAGQRQAQQWNQRAQVATAQDRIDQFNTQTANDFTMANAQREQQQFDNRMRLGAARSGALEGMAGVHEGRANRTRQMVGGIGQTVGYGMGAAGQYFGMNKAGAPAPVVRQASAYETSNPAAIGSNAALQPALATRRKAR
jgi:hypothetical protein